MTHIDDTICFLICLNESLWRGSTLHKMERSWRHHASRPLNLKPPKTTKHIYSHALYYTLTARYIAKSRLSEVFWQAPRGPKTEHPRCIMSNAPSTRALQILLNLRIHSRYARGRKYTINWRLSTWSKGKADHTRDASCPPRPLKLEASKYYQTYIHSLYNKEYTTALASIQMAVFGRCHFEQRLPNTGEMQYTSNAPPP